jgi:hypothetical protein
MKHLIEIEQAEIAVEIFFCMNVIKIISFFCFTIRSMWCCLEFEQVNHTLFFRIIDIFVTTALFWYFFISMFNYWFLFLTIMSLFVSFSCFFYLFSRKKYFIQKINKLFLFSIYKNILSEQSKITLWFKTLQYKHKSFNESHGIRWNEMRWPVKREICPIPYHSESWYIISK